MKYTQRLDYGRLAEVLHERGLADLDAIRELLQLSQEGGMPFCEALVTSNLVSDWDLSKVVCEIFQLPFMPLDLITPNPAVLEEIDNDYFRKHQIVPLDLFGQVMTVVMPALVSAEVLAQVSAMTDCTVIPMVGTVESNRRWCNDNLSAAPTPDLEGGWESMFDAADAEVTATDVVEDPLAALDDTPAALPSDAPEGLDALSGGIDLDASLEFDTDVLETDALDLGAIEALPADGLDALEDVSGLDLDAPSPATSESPDAGSGDSSVLPPMPEFGGGDQRHAG